MRQRLYKNVVISLIIFIVIMLGAIAEYYAFELPKETPSDEFIDTKGFSFFILYVYSSLTASIGGIILILLRIFIFKKQKLYASKKNKWYRVFCFLHTLFCLLSLYGCIAWLLIFMVIGYFSFFMLFINLPITIFMSIDIYHLFYKKQIPFE